MENSTSYKNTDVNQYFYVERGVFAKLHNNWNWLLNIGKDEIFFHTITTRIAYKELKDNSLATRQVEQESAVLSKVAWLVGKLIRPNSVEEMDHQAKRQLYHLWTQKNDYLKERHSLLLETICTYFYLPNPSEEQTQKLDEAILTLLAYKGDRKKNRAQVELIHFFKDRCGDNAYQRMHQMRLLLTKKKVRENEHREIEALFDELHTNNRLPLFLIDSYRKYFKQSDPCDFNKKHHFAYYRWIAEKQSSYSEQIKLELAKELLYTRITRWLGNSCYASIYGEQAYHLRMDIERAEKIAGELPHHEEAKKIVEIISLLKRVDIIDVESEERLTQLLEEVVGEREVINFYLTICFVNRVHYNDYRSPFDEEYHYENINKYRGYAAWQMARYGARLGYRGAEIQGLSIAASCGITNAQILLETCCRQSDLPETVDGFDTYITAETPYKLLIDLERKLGTPYYTLRLIAYRFWVDSPNKNWGEANYKAHCLVKNSRASEAQKEIALHYISAIEVLKKEPADLVYFDLLTLRSALEQIFTEENENGLEKFCEQNPQHVAVLFFAGELEAAKELGLQVERLKITAAKAKSRARPFS